MNPNASPFNFNPTAASFTPGGAPGSATGDMPLGAGQQIPRHPPQPYGYPPQQLTPAQQQQYQQQLQQQQQFQHQQYQQHQQQYQAQHPLVGHIGAYNTMASQVGHPPHRGNFQPPPQGQQQRQQQHGAQGGAGGRLQQPSSQGKGVKGPKDGCGSIDAANQQAVAPAPMTAIQKAEARAKAAAAEAEKQAAQKKAEKKAKQAAAQKVAAEESAVQKAAEEEAAKAHVEAKAAEEERSATPASETLPVGEETTWEDAAIAPADPAVNKAEAKQLDAPKSTPGTEPDAEEDSLGLGAGERKERDEREHLNLVFIGHVDAGKSTFCGQILYQTDQVDARTIEKYEKEAKEKNRDSWFLAFIMDTNEEERAKGKTVEVGRAHFETARKRYTILDAPGHKNYVPNMIAGACQADVGVLVISARKGEFETGFERGGQTREHALLAKTLGVRLLVVVINKMDDPTVKWSQERFNECEEKLSPFLKGCGYNVKKDVVFVPISALTAANVVQRFKGAPWYNGPCFLEVLDMLPACDRNVSGALRLPILSKYKDMGTVVEGKVEQGTIAAGDKLFVMPNRVPVEVLNVWLDQDEVAYLVGGENARVKLKDISDDDILPGFVLTPRGDTACPAVRRFEAQLRVVELLEHKSIFSAGYTAILHVHAAAEECVIMELTSAIDKKTGKRSKRKPMFVKSGEVITCIIEVEQNVCIEPFEQCPQMGRFTLRDEGTTIGIGKVLELMPGP